MNHDAMAIFVVLFIIAAVVAIAYEYITAAEWWMFGFNFERIFIHRYKKDYQGTLFYFGVYPLDFFFGHFCLGHAVEDLPVYQGQIRGGLVSVRYAEVYRCRSYLPLFFRQNRRKIYAIDLYNDDWPGRHYIDCTAGGPLDAVKLLLKNLDEAWAELTEDDNTVY